MPEFLAEGTAIHNLMNPDRIVIGTSQDQNGRDAFEVLSRLCRTSQDVKIVNPNIPSSELGKIFSNAMLA